MPDLTLSSQLSHAQGLIDRGDPSGAVAVSRQILLAMPRCVDPYAILGQAMLVLGHLASAEALFARTLAVNPQHAEAALGMGLVQYRRGAHGAALAWFQRAWESHHDGEHERARWLWSAVAAEAGWEPGTLSRGGLAFLMLRSGMFGQAVLEFSSALEEMPERDDLAVGLVQASYRAGDYAVASHASDACWSGCRTASFPCLFGKAGAGIGRRRTGEGDAPTRTDSGAREQGGSEAFWQ